MFFFNARLIHTSTLWIAVVSVLPHTTSFLYKNSSTSFSASSTSGGAQDASLNFLVLGDWGGLPVSPYRTPVETAVASRVSKLANSTHSQFLLALGDNFYFDGVQSVEDPRFQETYNHVFSAKDHTIDWYLIAGNHDHHGNVSAQIEYSNLVKQWNFPGYYYQLYWAIGNSASRVEILMLDTILLCGNTGPDALHLQPPGPRDTQLAETQWAWLEKRLQSSSADYLLVAGHYPVFSIAEHGPTKLLVQRLLPLLYKYKVTAYLSGHDHNLQHLQYNQSGHTVDYFVSGAANFVNPSVEHKHSVPPGSLRFHWNNIFKLGGLASVQTTTQNMTWSFIESSGKTLYRHTMFPRRLL